MEGIDLLKPLRILHSMGIHGDKLSLLMDLAVSDEKAKYIIPNADIDPTLTGVVDVIKLRKFLKGLG